MKKSEIVYGPTKPSSKQFEEAFKQIKQMIAESADKIIGESASSENLKQIEAQMKKPLKEMIQDFENYHVKATKDPIDDSKIMIDITVTPPAGATTKSDSDLDQALEQVLINSTKQKILYNQELYNHTLLNYILNECKDAYHLDDVYMNIRMLINEGANPVKVIEQLGYDFPSIGLILIAISGKKNQDTIRLYLEPLISLGKIKEDIFEKEEPKDPLKEVLKDIL